MSTSPVNSKLSALRNKLSTISSMRRLWLVTFRCMSDSAALPDGELERTGNSDDQINDYIKTFHKVAVFPRERLAPLRSICTEVYKTLKDKGLLLGNSGAYIIPNRYTGNVQDFLDKKAQEYRAEIAKIIADYKSVYESQVHFATRGIADEHLRSVIINLIPTKEEFIKRNYCSFAPYALALSDGVSDEDLQKIAPNVEEIHAEENRRFLNKIYEIFATYLQRYDAEMEENKVTRAALLFQTAKRAEQMFGRLNIALAGTEVYADLQAMRRIYGDIRNVVLVYMENLAKGDQYVPDHLCDFLRAKVEALSSPENFKAYCGTKSAPHKNGDALQAVKTESYSISSEDFGVKDQGNDSEYEAKPVDVSTMIAEIKALQPLPDSRSAADDAADPDPQVLTSAPSATAAAVIECDPFGDNDVAAPAAITVDGAPCNTAEEETVSVIKELLPEKSHNAAVKPDAVSIGASAVVPGSAVKREPSRPSFASRFSMR